MSPPTSPFRAALVRLLCSLAVAAAFAAPSTAQVYSWTGATSSTWTSDANWTPAGFNGEILQVVLFNTASAQNLATTLDTSYVLSGIAVVDPAADVSIGPGASGTMTLFGGGIDLSNATRNLTVDAGITLFGDQSLTAGAGRLLTVNGAINTGLTGTHTIGGDGNTTLNGAVGSLAGLRKTGGGMLILGSTGNTYTGGTRIEAGTVQLGQANVIPDTGPVTLAGGTLSTGATTGNSDVAASLVLDGPSTIDLGTGVHTLTFNGLTVTSGSLTVEGWTGTPGESGDEGRLLFSGLGSNPNVDFAAFLSNVNFTGHPAGGLFIPDGAFFELVPLPVPEPSSILGLAAGLVAFGAAGRRLRTVPAAAGN